MWVNRVGLTMRFHSCLFCYLFLAYAQRQSDSREGAGTDRVQSEAEARRVALRDEICTTALALLNEIYSGRCTLIFMMNRICKTQHAQLVRVCSVSVGKVGNKA